MHPRRPSKLAWPEEYEAFRRRMRKARLDSGLSLREVAARMGRSLTFVAESESGERRVDVVELKQFAKVYKRSVMYFVREGF